MNIKIVPIQKQRLNVASRVVRTVGITGGSGSGGLLDDYVATDQELRNYYGLN